MPQQIDGVLLTHEHGDHVCGLEVLCRKFDVPIYCNSLTAEAVRSDSHSRSIETGEFSRPAPIFRFATSPCKHFPSRMTRLIRWGTCFTPARAARIYHRPRLRDKDDRRAVAPGAHARDRDESRRKTFAERPASAVAGETTNPIATWPSVERSCGRRHRGIVTGKNRARRARTS